MSDEHKAFTFATRCPKCGELIDESGCWKCGYVKTGPVNSRSRQKRIAAMKGEEPPTFSDPANPLQADKEKP